MLATTTHLVLMPSYNPGVKVYETVRAARQYWSPVWVVVDGSSDGSAEGLQALAAQDAQRAENVLVVLTVVTQLQAITLGDLQRNFQYINRVQAQAIAVQRGVGRDLIGCDLEVQTLNHQLGNFTLQLCGTQDTELLGSCMVIIEMV